MEAIRPLVRQFVRSDSHEHCELKLSLPESCPYLPVVSMESHLTSQRSFAVTVHSLRRPSPVKLIDDLDKPVSTSSNA